MKFMQLTLLLLIACALLLAPAPQLRVSAQAASAVEVLGNFSSVRRAGEDDALGYTLRLWMEGNKVFGLFAAYVGPPADPPVGILEDVKFDSRTRRLSFTARLSTGVVSGQGYDRVASRDRFVFKGVLTQREVCGTLQQSDELFPDRRPGSEKIHLRRSQSLTELMMPPPPTYSEWETWADEILQRRGPKW